jgi:hypothetical protein
MNISQTQLQNHASLDSGNHIDTSNVNGGVSVESAYS